MRMTIHTSCISKKKRRGKGNASVVQVMMNLFWKRNDDADCQKSIEGVSKKVSKGVGRGRTES